jgi:hypothetical protein
MHRTPSSGIMHCMFVVRRGKRIGKEEPNVCTREQDLFQPGRALDSRLEELTVEEVPMGTFETLL